ncbi:MAG: GTPase HflX [Acidobacteriota bacterium]|nr:GTPase HflX [Acidobacteriota bacterium]
MNSRGNDRSWQTGRSQAERVFLVGVEFLARPTTKRGGKRPSAEDAGASLETGSSSPARKLAAGKVPPVARAARNAASPLQAPEHGHQPFSAEESMAELRELATSAGGSVIGEFLQRRQKPDPATLIGSGKLEELQGAVASSSPDVVIFDHELTPSQQRNLERQVDSRVIDRTQLILDIFARHARTREGQLQVELAQLQYLLPRLTGRGVEMSQLGGGIGTRGPGETQLETDRRKIYRRIKHVKVQLENVRRIRSQQRQRRESVPIATVALVGYTNAGKSTLFNALTNAGVLESARMFATLDPTLRSVTLPSKRQVLLSDTVGFIRNLPHTLVSAFRATLEEVQRASLILQVADVTSPVAGEQQEQVEEVLRELESQDKPRLYVMNKVDLLPAMKRGSLQNSDRVVHVSAAKGLGLDSLKEHIDAQIEEDAVRRISLRVPQSEGKALSTLDAKARVYAREYRDGYVELDVEAPESVLRKMKSFARK